MDAQSDGTDPELGALLLEQEWRRCFPVWDLQGDESEEDRFQRVYQGFVHFTSSHWYISTPSGKQLFEMREAQLSTAEDWLRERFTVALKARQIGFSTLSGAFAFWLGFGYGDRKIIMISRNEREAIKLLDKTKYGVRWLPEWMLLKGPYIAETVTKLEFTNDSRIESLPSASDPARGETVYAIIVDEIGFLPNSEQAWASIEPVTDVGAMDPDPLGGGRVIMLGTANGEGDLLHREFTKSRGRFGNGSGRFWGVFHSWRAHTDRDDAWFEAKCAELPEWQRAQEYPDNAEEAFLKSGRPVFDMDRLRAMEFEDPDRGYLKRTDEGIEFVKDGGNLRVWRLPSADCRYSMGVDVAEGLENGDFSSVHVLESVTGELVAHWHGHIDADLLGSEIVATLGEWYNKALAIVESNNHGLSTLHALQRSKYFPIYFRRRHEQRNNRQQTEVMGWATTAKSKALAIDELGMAIRNEDIIVFDSETVAEMRTFVREGNGRMNGSNGTHDDRVMSLAIANQGLKYVWEHRYVPKKDPGPGTFGWAMKHMFEFEDDLDEPEIIPMGAFNVR